MRDFASPYRKVPYFGIWAEETADQHGKRDAMAVPLFNPQRRLNPEKTKPPL